MSSPFLAAALAELERDPRASVFPIADKRPLTRWGKGDPTISLARSPEQAQRMAANPRFADATGAGLALRADQGVYDADSPAAIRWCTKNLPDTRVVTTGRPEGGRHYYVALPTPVRHNPKLKPAGLEFKTYGGYVVLPGSLHASGGVYELARDVQVADIPGRLASKLGKPRPQLDGTTDATHVELHTWSTLKAMEPWIAELNMQSAKDQLVDTERWLRRHLPLRDAGWGDAAFGQGVRLGVWVGHGAISYDAAVDHLKNIVADLDNGQGKPAGEQHVLRSIRRGVAAGARSVYE